MGRVREEKRRGEKKEDQRREEKRRREKIREEEESEERRWRCAKRWKRRDSFVFPMICGSGGSKSRLTKAARAEPSGEMRDEQLHAVVARGIFRSQIMQKTPGSV